MIKAIKLNINSKGEASVAGQGVASVLIKELVPIKKSADFPKGVESIEVWTSGGGLVKRVTKSKLDAQAKHDAAYAKAEAKAEKSEAKAEK